MFKNARRFGGLAPTATDDFVPCPTFNPDRAQGGDSPFDRRRGTLRVFTECAMTYFFEPRKEAPHPCPPSRNLRKYKAFYQFDAPTAPACQQMARFLIQK